MRVNVISESKQEFNGLTYYLCDKYFQKKGIRLHRVVWMYHNGEIPKGFHVHHIDSDRSNNQIENLELISKNIHAKNHSLEPERVEYSKKHIETIRVKAIEWHGSKEGLEWHSKQGKENWAKRILNKYICTYCNTNFETLNIYAEKSNHFCSNKCKSGFRRKQGTDNIEYTCQYCKEPFIASKYIKKNCCSRDCSVKLRWGK